MCRGLQQQISERDRLNIKAFYIRLSHHHTHINHNHPTSLPDYLTLHYLPRINGSPLQIDGFNIRSDTPAFLTLHRVLSGDAVTYGSRERVRTSSGARFEVYIKDDKVIKGIFRKGQFRNWKMECKFSSLESTSDSSMDSGIAGCVGVKEAEVLVEVEEEERMQLREKVDMAVAVRRWRRGKGRSSSSRGGCLEEIPEEERETEPDIEAEEGCCCICDECVAAEGGGEDVVGLELEGVRKAVDVGFWMVCVGVGVGFLVSKASSRSVRKSIFF